VIDDPCEAGLSPELELSASERLVLISFRLSMMEADITAEGSGSKGGLKRRDRDAEVMRAIGIIKALAADAPRWAIDVRNAADVTRRDSVHDTLCSAGETLGRHISSRPRALMVLIDAVIFDPWSGGAKWQSAIRQEQLAAVAQRLPALQPQDLATVQQEYEASVRRLRRRSVAFGGRTSSAFERLPKPVGESLQSATAWVRSLHVDVVDVAVRAEVMTRLVVIEAEHDEEKARRVVQSIQERLAVVAAKQEELVAKIRDLRGINLILQTENRELRRQLQEECQRAQMAEQALRAALDHIFDAPLALSAAPASEGGR
jgi:hypothetical protein